jgi:hypothetical protein
MVTVVPFEVESIVDVVESLVDHVEAESQAGAGPAGGQLPRRYR